MRAPHRHHGAQRAEFRRADAGWQAIHHSPRHAALNRATSPLAFRAVSACRNAAAASALRPKRTKRPSGTHNREAQRPVAGVLNGNSELWPFGLRVRPESFDGISMTCSVAGDRYSWYAANKAKQFQWQYPWRYPQVVEMTPNVSGQTLRPNYVPWT
jgi:hypothetical protein